MQKGLAAHDRGEAGDRTDRQVEPAGDEDEGAAGGDDADGRRLESEVLHVRFGEERAARDRERDEQRDEGDHHAVLAEHPDVEPGRKRGSALRLDLLAADRSHAAVAPAAVPNAARRTASSFMCAWSNSATIRPLCITSTRCASPSSSSCSDEISRTAMPSAARDLINA